MNEVTYATSNYEFMTYLLQTERAQVFSQSKPFLDENKQFRQIIDEKRKEIEPLHQALGQLRFSNTEDRERSYIYSSEEELNNVISTISISF